MLDEGTTGQPSTAVHAVTPANPWRHGALAAVLVLIADQASKVWLLFGFDLGARGFYQVTPFLDLVLVWNTGISYGLFPQEGPVGRTVLLGLKLAALVVLTVWLVRTTSRLTAVSLGMIIGGAVGNAADRAVFGAVVDFVFFHLDRWNFRWYVFNLADVGIVAGVVGILLDSFRSDPATAMPQNRPDSP
ncbi:MAG: signal peptidase [Variibacter sp.]|jgi:signal peptidase II|nr:signal peptidase [Variibacter sp.]